MKEFNGSGFNYACFEQEGTSLEPYDSRKLLFPLRSHRLPIFQDDRLVSDDSANRVIQGRIAHLLKRPVGRPPKGVKRIYGDFEYQAASWDEPRRVVAKVEWHPGELFPRVGFVVTNMPMEADWIIHFYNQRGTAEQHIKEGKQAINWTRLSCKGMAQNEVRLQLHALAYNLGVFLQATELPEEIADWSLTSLQTRLIHCLTGDACITEKEIGARVVRHARAITFQLAEVGVSDDLFNRILAAIHRLRPPPVPT